MYLIRQLLLLNIMTCVMFPCNIHKTEIMKIIFQYYITMRMKQFTLTHNRDMKKNKLQKEKTQPNVTQPISSTIGRHVTLFIQ